MDKTWKVILAFAGIFVAGLLVGGLVTLRVVKSLAPPRLGSPEQFSPLLMKRISSKLELTPEQQEKIRPLIARAADELHQMRRTVWTNSQAVMERVDGEIAAVLTPPQKLKFDQMREEQRERVRRFTEERNRRLRDSHRSGEHPPPPAP